MDLCARTHTQTHRERSPLALKYECIRVHLYMCTCHHTQVHMHTCVHVHMHICTYKPTCTDAHAHINLSPIKMTVLKDGKCTDMYACMHACIHAHTHGCTCTYNKPIANQNDLRTISARSGVVTNRQSIVSRRPSEERQDVD